MGLAIGIAVAYFVVAVTFALSLGKVASEADAHHELYDQERENG